VRRKSERSKESEMQVFEAMERQTHGETDEKKPSEARRIHPRIHFLSITQSGKQAKVGNLGGDKRKNAFFRRHGYREMITKLLSGRVTKKKAKLPCANKRIVEPGLGLPWPGRRKHERPGQGGSID
jgi:hypothetical protein